MYQQAIRSEFETKNTYYSFRFQLSEHLRMSERLFFTRIQSKTILIMSKYTLPLCTSVMRSPTDTSYLPSDLVIAQAML